MHFLQNTSDLHKKHCSQTLISVLVLQKLDLCLSFAAARQQKVQEKQHLSLHCSMLGGSQFLVRPVDTDLQLKSVNSWPDPWRTTTLDCDCHL